MAHQARKRFGQHFLTDRSVIDAIAHAVLDDGVASNTSTNQLVEIGPGLGALTDALLKAKQHLIAVEIDRDLIGRLRRRYKDDQLTVIEADALSFDFAGLPSPMIIAGNLPYNISSPLLIALIDVAAQVNRQVFMLQKEVVDRIVAQSSTKAYGRLTVMLQAYYHVKSLFDVPPEAFDPPPRVNSSIVQMIPRKTVSVVSKDWLETLLAAAFSQRRKMLRATLFKWLLPLGISDCALTPTDRPEDITVEQWIALANQLAVLHPNGPKHLALTITDLIE